MTQFPKTMQELIDDPKRFGLPTFEEFCQNPDKYRPRWDSRLAAADAGSKNLSHVVNRYVWEVEGVTCKSPEQAERIAREKGIDLNLGLYDIEPHVVPIGGGKCDILVRIVRKESHASGNQ